MEYLTKILELSIRNKIKTKFIALKISRPLEMPLHGIPIQRLRNVLRSKGNQTMKFG